MIGQGWAWLNCLNREGKNEETVISGIIILKAMNLKVNIQINGFKDDNLEVERGSLIEAVMGRKCIHDSTVSET